DPYGVEDRVAFGNILRGRTGRLFAGNQEAGPFNVEDPELLDVAGTRVAVVRIPTFGRIEGRDPALELAFNAPGESEIVSLASDRKVGHGPFQMLSAVAMDGHVGWG